MRVVIDERAWRDLDDIAAWIDRDNRAAARHEVEKIRHVIGLLAEFPGLARPGRAHGTWERMVPNSHYVIVFERLENPSKLIITSIMHAARHR